MQQIEHLVESMVNFNWNFQNNGNIYRLILKTIYSNLIKIIFSFNLYVKKNTFIFWNKIFKLAVRAIFCMVQRVNGDIVTNLLLYSHQNLWFTVTCDKHEMVLISIRLNVIHVGTSDLYPYVGKWVQINCTFGRWQQTKKYMLLVGKGSGKQSSSN